MAVNTPPSAEGLQRAEIKLIHIGKTALHLDDDTYRALLGGLCRGKTSSKDLTAAERRAVLDRMKALGFAVKPKAATGAAAVALIRTAQMNKLRALWYALADAGAVPRPAHTEACNDAIASWAMGRLRDLSALRFATGQQMSELIEQAKAWCVRVDADLTAR